MATAAPQGNLKRSHPQAFGLEGKGQMEEIVIDEAGDLKLHLYKFVREEGSDDGSEVEESKNPPKRTLVAILRVSREVLIGNSLPFKASLSDDKWAEAKRDVYQLEVASRIAMELCLRVLHKNLTEDSYTVPIAEIWEVIECCRERDIQTSSMEEWFEGWMEKKQYSTIEPVEMSRLLYPCYVFDHARGFALFTKTLAYRTPDHIGEINPTRYRHLHLEGNVIGSVNGARGSLRSKLLRGLLEPLGDFLKFKCTCRAESLLAYCTALSGTGLWPIHDAYRKSVQDILDSPGFTNFKCEAPESACYKCSEILQPSAADDVHRNISSGFDGLCLDCMNLTKSQNGDVHQEYWRHDRFGAYDSGCRISHGQPTWYFSYMGRKTEMKRHQALTRRERRSI